MELYQTNTQTITLQSNIFSKTAQDITKVKAIDELDLNWIFFVHASLKNLLIKFLAEKRMEELICYLLDH